VIHWRAQSRCTYEVLLNLGLRNAATEERTRLLIGVFTGLGQIAEVNAESASRIWTLATKVALKDAGRRGSDASVILLNWRIALGLRLSHCGTEELKDHRESIATYTASPEALLHPESYDIIASVSAAIRSSAVRPQNRAVVPPETSIVIQIEPTGCTPVPATLVNFSLGDRTWKRGAWAISKEKPPWSQTPLWWDAKVTLSPPQCQPLLFERALVHGPAEEGREDARHYGFRIQLGPASEEDVNQLRNLWHRWPKR